MGKTSCLFFKKENGRFLLVLSIDFVNFCNTIKNDFITFFEDLKKETSDLSQKFQLVPKTVFLGKGINGPKNTSF